MFKQALALRRALIFLGVLSCVAGDGSILANNVGYESLPFVISTFKDKCPNHLDPLFCYWDSLRYKLTNSKQIHEPTSENKTSENEISEDNTKEEITLEPPFMGSENHLYKRFIVFRRKNPVARGYKRGPGFRSWGGKRDPLFSSQNLDKKSKFASWGGKRDGELTPDDLELRDVADKRPKFQNWGGKRSINDNLEEYENEIEKRPIWKERYYLNEPFKKHVPKRPQFQSWGGKRGLYPWHGFFEYFHSQPRFYLNGGEKRKFSSWGGKRYDDNDDFWLKSSEENFKRHAFQNWGGKRASPDSDDPDAFETKESESSEKTKQRDKRKVKDNWEDEGNHSNFDSLGDENNRR